jgi:hypothetical protein
MCPAASWPRNGAAPKRSSSRSPASSNAPVAPGHPHLAGARPAGGRDHRRRARPPVSVLLSLPRAQRRRPAASTRRAATCSPCPCSGRCSREPDVRLFHAHALKRLGGEVRTAARLRRKPLVVSLHGGVFDVPVAELGTMLKPIENKTEWGKPFGALFGSRRVLEDADQVICVGQSELDKAKPRADPRPRRLPSQRRGLRQVRGRRRPRLPQPARHSHRRVPRAEPEPHRRQKNQLLLLEAFARFRAGQPDARLVLIGPETQPAYAANSATSSPPTSSAARATAPRPAQRRPGPAPGLPRRGRLRAAVHARALRHRGARGLELRPPRHRQPRRAACKLWCATTRTACCSIPNAATASADLAALLQRLANSEPATRHGLAGAGLPRPGPL